MQQHYYVYVLLCSDGSYYVGHTDNIENRLEQHKNKVYQTYTSSRLPIKLVFHQEFESRDEAFTAERKIKDWSRKKKEALINGDFDLLSQHAKKKFQQDASLDTPHAMRHSGRAAEDKN